MARLRSREAETEDVNPRRLQRGAVKRTHISPWAVGGDEIAPGVVGPTHLQPRSVGETNLDPTVLDRMAAPVQFVAAFDASDAIKAASNFVCTGMNDHSEIQQAIDAAGVGGTVFLIGQLFTLGATVVVDQGVRVIGQSVRFPYVATTFDGSAFQVKPGCGIELMLIDTAGYFFGTANTGHAIEGIEETDGAGWFHVAKVETVTTGVPGIIVDNTLNSRTGNVWIMDCPIFRTDTGPGIALYNVRHVFIRDCQGHRTDVSPNTGIYMDVNSVNVDVIGGDWIGDIDIHGDAARIIGVDGGTAGRVRLLASSTNSIVMGCMRMAEVSDIGTGNQLANNNVGGAATDVNTDPATTVVSETAYGQAAAVGTSTTLHARSDHTHGTPALPTPAQIGAAVAGETNELLMQDGVSNPPVPLTNEAGDDWLYEG